LLPRTRSRRPELGSLEWARRTDGLLRTRREELEMARQAARYGFEGMVHRVAKKLGSERPKAEFDLARLPLPDTRAAREAEELMTERLSRVWVNHSFRTYVYAYVLGRFDRLDFDEEVLYISSLVHDISLADSNIAVRQRCFSLSAAELADELVARVGWDGSRRELVGDAITRHVNLWIPKRAAPEAYLLHVGTKLDVVGLRFADIAPGLMKEILERYPRGDFKNTFRPKMRAHHAAVPNGRPGFYARYFRSDKRRARSPFPE
jgi:hypothetical protein